MSRRAPPSVLAFDVFGTVVDWHSAVAREIARRLPGANGPDLAREWRAGYQPALEEVRAGRRDWCSIDVLHREILDDWLRRHGWDEVDEATRRALNHAWHRLDPWPDSVAGLRRLKQRYTICSLSNGNIDLLDDLAIHGGLPWDRILSAETFHAYKPQSATYLGVARVFGVAPSRVMMVAAHQTDLDAARRYGLQTAYVERRDEFGADRPKNVAGDPVNTLHVSDIEALAAALDC